MFKKKIRMQETTNSLPFSEAILKSIQCCIKDEIHYVKEPLLLPCQHHICKSCVLSAYKQIIKCGYENCNQMHTINDINSLTSIKMVELVIQQYDADLRKRMFDDLCKSIDYVKGLKHFS